ncbi:helix-turn-helix domain-containing protein [Halarchaeum sp. P4]|uniref:helix-turn-helix domain-containing protein n=1 Tax=Halarchaeum sp. P4 TaxID=3421639 RepID=UPI003EBB6445
MSVIADVEVAATSFELGRALTVPGRADVELEEMVPLEHAVVPLFWLNATSAAEFVASVEANENVEDLAVVEEEHGRTLYSLQWDARDDRLLGAIPDHDGYLLSATGSETTWLFQVRFPDHDAFEAFCDQCSDNYIDYDVRSLYHSTRPDSGRWYGLTEQQYETLLLAHERGYYDIPRQVTTRELAAELGISDQAVTERLRRAIRTFTDNAFRI